MPWKATIFHLLPKLIDELFNWLGIRKRRLDYEERQNKRDEAHIDPGDAFRDHFSLHNNNKNNTNKTDKTDIGSKSESE